jgi:hypothetical protein
MSSAANSAPRVTIELVSDTMSVSLNVLLSSYLFSRSPSRPPLHQHISLPLTFAPLLACGARDKTVGSGFCVVCIPIFVRPLICTWWRTRGISGDPTGTSGSATSTTL